MARREYWYDYLPLIIVMPLWCVYAAVAAFATLLVPHTVLRRFNLLTDFID